MTSQRKKQKLRVISTQLRQQELSQPGVGKMLLKENQRARDEVEILKKSLRVNQNELEKLRSSNHALDKQNSLLNFQLDNSLVPETLKLVASTFGTGFAVSYFFANRPKMGIGVGVVSIVVYAVILWFYRKKI